MTRIPGRRGRPAAVAVVLTAVLAGCAAPGGSSAEEGSRSASPEGLAAFADCVEFTDHMRDLSARRSASGASLDDTVERPYVFASDVGPLGGPAAAMPAASVTRGDAARTATSGDLVVTLDGGRLYVVDAAADRPVVRSSTTLPDGPYAYLLLAGSRALLVGPAGEPGLGHLPPHVPGAGTSPTTMLTLVDLSDVTRPRSSPALC